MEKEKRTGPPSPSRISMLYNILQSSIWFLPSLLTALSIVGSFALINIDRHYFPKLDAESIWIFAGSVEGVRGLLSTMATALITIISISFSITIIAVQQAANQYSPRVVKSFTSDKGNQFVLGIYLATFIFVILVLRQVGGPHHFLPVISVGTSIFLTLVCLGFLIFFIHRMVNSLQVIRIVQRIHHDLLRGINLLYPEKIKEGEAEPQGLDKIMNSETVSEKRFKLRSTRSGFLNRISNHKLAQIKDPRIKWILVPAKIGDFIIHDQVLAEIGNYSGEDPKLNKLIRNAFEFGDRTIESDPLYGIGQLIDISLRALSPAMNAPANAEYALYHMGDALSVLVQRRLHEIPMRVPDNPTKYYLNNHSWNEFIHFSFDQIRRNSQQEIRITALSIFPHNRKKAETELLGGGLGIRALFVHETTHVGILLRRRTMSMKNILITLLTLYFAVSAPAAFAQHGQQKGASPAGTAGQKLQQNDQLLKDKLKGMTAKEAVDFANQCRLEKSSLVSFVSPEAVHFQFTDGTEITVPLPRDQMVVSIAPYLTWTHPCTTHYISKCDAELKNTPVKIKAVTAKGKVLIDKTLKSPTGFFDLWLPRDQEINLFVSAKGKKAKGKITTYKDSPTCNSTLKLQ